MLKKLSKKIYNNLIRPQRIPRKIFDKLNYYIKYKKYNRIVFEKEQNSIFDYYGLDREKGIKKLNIIKKHLINHLDVKRANWNNLSSEHEEFFSSLSISKKIQVNNILEIGTYDGYNSLLLANLFSSSTIDTIDLPENEEDFINYYDRKGRVSEFIRKRNALISKNKNINFFSQNSLRLLNYKKKYDLIWIDGAHGYPMVCIDIINSLHIINDKGIIMCDDVQINVERNSSDKMYYSLASLETLNELKKDDLIEFKLIYKRLNPENNCDKNKRKFIAIINKI